MRKLLSLSVAAALVLSACGGESSNTTAGNAPAAQQQSTAPVAVTGPAVTGLIEVDQLPTLPPGITLVLKLLDTTDKAALPVVVTEAATPAANALPFKFALPYDAARIDATHSYAISATLQAETLVLYGTGTPVPVLTNGAPSSELKLALVRGGQPSADVPPDELAKKDFADLEAQIGALRRIQGERLEEEIAVGWDAFVEPSGQIRMAREQVDFGDAGSAAFRYAYRGGKPWVVERVQGGKKILVGWSEDGTVILNESASGKAGDDVLESLYQRAALLYREAATKR